MEKGNIRLKRIRLDKLNNAEYAIFCKRTVSNILNAGRDKLGITKSIYDSFNANTVLIGDIVSQSQISDETARIREVEKRCADAIRYFLGLVSAGRRSLIEADRQAYISLYNATKVYQGILRLPQLQQIQQTRGLVYDMGKSENAKHIIALKLDVAIQKINDANEEYGLLVDRRRDEMADRKLPSGGAVREEMDEQYEKMMIEVFVRDAYDPEYKGGDFIKAQNALIDETNARYNLRKGLHEHYKDKNEEAEAVGRELAEARHLVAELEVRHEALLAEIAAETARAHSALDAKAAEEEARLDAALAAEQAEAAHAASVAAHEQAVLDGDKSLHDKIKEEGPGRE